MMIPPLTDRQQATLTCTAPGLCSGSPPKITWMWRGKGEKDSYIIGNITALKTENLTTFTKRHVSTLTFNSSADHHNTNITCDVSFTGSITAEETVTLNVNCDSKHVRKPQISGRATVKEGDVLNLTCSVDSFPPSVICWSKSTKQAEHQSHNLIKVHGRHEICHQDTSIIFLFSVTNVTAEDAGLYICSAQHLNYTLREEINPHVFYSFITKCLTLLFKMYSTDVRKPQISGSATVMEGDHLNLTCSVDSVPPSVIKWTKSGANAHCQDNIFSKADNSTVIYRLGQRGHVSFSIMDVTVEEAGRYICTATYQNDSTTEEIYV
ncbi:hypothetical protein CCH79_00021068, partial [Gambusia affinis]